MLILLHTSKTMRAAQHTGIPFRSPALIGQASRLAAYVGRLSPEQIVQSMKVSKPLADKTLSLFADWSAGPSGQLAAMDSFIGDIYSGLQADSFAAADRTYADEHLRILSGLYGVLRPLDAVSPYRLEMGYRLPDPEYANLYDFWGDAIARTLPTEGPIINLAAVEYAKVVTPFIDTSRCITPKFLTLDAKTGEPAFVVVHAKIARGAFARWLIQQRVTAIGQLPAFTAIGYAYDRALSTPAEPVFVCNEFGGKGLSVRLR